MDISLLRTFLEVARIRHFGRAADSLFVTQSAVSARIKLLESTLGVELFTRKRNDIQLTPAGDRLRQHAESIVKGWDRAKQAIALDPEHSDFLSIGCIYDLWRIIIANFTAAFRKARPETVLHLDIQPSEILLQRIALGVMDLGFMFDPPQSPDLDVKQITEVPLVLVATRSYDDPLEAMANNYVMVEWGGAFAVAHAGHYPDMPSPVLRTNSGSAALDWIIEQQGAGYLPMQMVEPYIEENKLFSVADAPVIERFVYAVYRSENLDKMALNKAMAVIKEFK